MAKRAVPAKLVPLLAGAYQSRSLISGAQREVNLYPENNPQGSQAPVPTTHFLTPGLLLNTAAPALFPFRRLGLYLATNGDLFAMLGSKVYFIDEVFAFTEIGNIANAASPLSIADNGLAMVIVDGTSVGYAVDLDTHALGIIGAGYQAASKTDYLDTYLVFNVIGTNRFYISLSNCTYAQLIGGTAFDPLDIAAKTGSPDPINTLIALRGELWLVGTLTAEVWGNSGNPEFAFERIPGSLVEHGCAAPHSIAKTDASAYFLMQDKQGRAILAQTAGYAVQQVSTYAMEQEWQSYPQIADAIAYTRQDQGHAFYVITFPTADKTWAMELATHQWHEWESLDGNGVPHRHRGNCFAAAYGKNLVGDFENNNLYNLDQSTYTDNGNPIRRLRTFPHMVDTGNRVTYHSFIANMEVGQSLNPADDPQVGLRWSDDRGASFGNTVLRSMGKTGEYIKSPKWSRLGMARDRVFELSWSVNAKTALLGAFVASTPLST